MGGGEDMKEEERGWRKRMEKRIEDGAVLNPTFPQMYER
jgi:hypothetical protein